MWQYLLTCAWRLTEWRFFFPYRGAGCLSVSWIVADPSKTRAFFGHLFSYASSGNWLVSWSLHLTTLVSSQLLPLVVLFLYHRTMRTSFRLLIAGYSYSSACGKQLLHLRIPIKVVTHLHVTFYWRPSVYSAHALTSSIRKSPWCAIVLRVAADINQR